MDGEATLVLAFGAFAHEGHGDPAWYGSVLHYLLEREHLPLALAVLASAGLAARWVSSHVRRRPAARAPAGSERRDEDES